MSKFTESLVNGLAPIIQVMATEQIVTLLNTFAKNDIKSYTKVVKELYVPIDTHLEDLTKKSKSKIDDVVVAAFKNALEQSASENGVELPEVK